MRILFDPDFEHGYWPGPLRGGDAAAGEAWAGPSHFAQILESALGLGGPTLSMRERAAALVPAIRATPGFWSDSAAVDPFGTARRLLQWRDTLTMGGWRGQGTERRLGSLGSLIASCPPGLPDRLIAINALLARRPADIEFVHVCTPRTDLEPLWRCTLDLLERRSTSVVETDVAAAPAAPGSDLAQARAASFEPRGDGSLRLLRPVGPLAAAEEVAAWLASRRASEVVIVGGDPALDAALHRHGLPTTGVPHQLRDGGPLQVLPLVLELGWYPQDAQRAYELLTLPSGPVPGEVARRLRKALGEWPAVNSDQWHAALVDGLSSLDDPERRERVKRRLEVLWDGRVARDGSYPAAEAVRRTAMVHGWLVARIAVATDNGDTWRQAASQCESLIGLVRHSGLSELTPAQLRRLVSEATRSAGGESPFAAQAGVHHVGAAGGVAGSARVVVWWRFDASASTVVPRLPFTCGERDELASLGVELGDPARLAASQARRWRRPLDQAQEALLLVCPDNNEAGEELHPHPLWDELVARVHAGSTRRNAERALVATSMADVVSRRRRQPLAVPSPHRDWTIPSGVVQRREKESPSSVEALIECPFQWLLHYVGHLYPPDSAQVAAGTNPRLLGDLLHAIMNQLFEGRAHLAPDEAAIRAGIIFEREGPRLVAALFLPDNRAQHDLVLRVARQTAQRLYALMRDGNLEVLATEKELVGNALGTTFAGRVDLVLGHPPRILDLKWSGAPRKREALREGTALQLAAYAFLQRDETGAFPPVGYFVMDTQRLLTTDPAAFPGSEPVSGPTPAETWHRLETTHDKAWQTAAAGQIAAPGATPGRDNRRKQARVKDGQLMLSAECQWCDYTTLCGYAFKEQA